MEIRSKNGGPPPVEVAAESMDASPLKATAAATPPSAATERPSDARRAAFNAVGKVASTATAAPDPAKIGVLGYVSRAILEDDLLRFFPPEVKRGVFTAIKDAFAGAWGKLRSAARIFQQRTSEEVAETADSQLAGLSNSEDEARGPLSREELQAIAQLIDGPIAAIVRERGTPPRTLDELKKLLSDDQLAVRLVDLRMQAADRPSPDQARADVEAALIVAKAVVGKMAQHMEVGVADASVLDARGRLDPEQVAALPPALRLVFRDPVLGSEAIAAIKRGQTLSSQLVRTTPDHLLADLHQVSLALTAGSYLWLEDYLKTGRRPPISDGDLGRLKESLEGVATRVESFLVGPAKKEINQLLPEGELRDRYSRAIDEKDPERREDLLHGVAEDAPVGPAREKIERTIHLFGRAEEIRREDPEAILALSTERLDRFDAFRHQAVRVRVHGVGPSAQSLEARIKNDKNLALYGKSIIEHTVGHDYAGETAKTARTIVSSVSGLALLGIPIQQIFGDGMMHAVLSTSEDVLGDLSEMLSLRGQGLSWKQLLLGPQNIGKLPMLLGAMALGGRAHTAIEAGAGGLGGLELGIASTALTIYTSLSSFFIFRGIAKTMAKEGKIVRGGLNDEVRAALSAVAIRASEIPGGPASSAQLEHMLEQAFDVARTKVQGVPNGRALVAALEANGVRWPKEVLDAVHTAHDGVVDLLKAGPDLDREVDAMVHRTAGDWIGAAKEAGFAIADQEVPALVSRLEAAIKSFEGAESSPARIAGAVESLLSEIIARAGSGPLTEEAKRGISAAADLAKTNAGALEAELKKRFSPAMSKLVSRFAFDQVVANPVRLRLLTSVLVTIGMSVTIGLVAPQWFVAQHAATWLERLRASSVVAVTGSGESWVTAIWLKIDDLVHLHGLKKIGEKFDDEVALAQSRGAPATAER